MNSVPIHSDRRDSATSHTGSQIPGTNIEKYGEGNKTDYSDAAATVTGPRTPDAVDQSPARREILEEERLRRFSHHSQSGLPAAIVILVQPMLLFSCWFWTSISINDSDLFTPTPGGTCFFFFRKIKSGLRPISGFMAFLSISLALTPYLSFPAYIFNSRGHPRLALVLSLLTIPYWITFIFDLFAKLLLPIFCCKYERSRASSPPRNLDEQRVHQLLLQ